MAESKGNSLDLSNAEEVNKAIAMLAIRVAKLETGAPAVGTGDGKDLGRVLAATLSGLKEELEKFKEENAKLKYQIKHLKRSLEAEEAPLSAVSGCAL